MCSSLLHVYFSFLFPTFCAAYFEAFTGACDLCSTFTYFFYIFATYIYYYILLKKLFHTSEASQNGIEILPRLLENLLSFPGYAA
jgi:hypothetical protein